MPVEGIQLSKQWRRLVNTSNAGLIFERQARRRLARGVWRMAIPMYLLVVLSNIRSNGLLIMCRRKNDRTWRQ